MTRLKKRKHRMEDMIEDEINMMMDRLMDREDREWKERISPMKDRDNGNERLDNKEMNNSDR